MEILVIIALAIPAGYLAGNSLVYFFNNMPANLLKIDQKENRQRINSYPWKLVFSAIFMVFFIYLCTNNWQLGIVRSITIWIIFFSILSSKIYGVVIDKISWIIGFCAIGFLPYSGNFMNMLRGSLLALGIMVLLMVLSKSYVYLVKDNNKIINNNNLKIWRFSIKIEDIVLLAMSGLILRVEGVLTVLISSIFLLFCDYFLVKLKLKKEMYTYAFWLCICVVGYLILGFIPKI